MQSKLSFKNDAMHLQSYRARNTTKARASSGAREDCRETSKSPRKVVAVHKRGNMVILHTFQSLLDKRLGET